jgi:hypothetical protein
MAGLEVRGEHMNHARRSVMIVLTLAVALALVNPGAALAGKRPSGTFSLVLMDGATEARYGGRITFNVSTTATRPYVGLRCWQGSTLVGDGYVGYFDSYPYDPWFNLSSPYWDATARADCTARLFKFTRRGGEYVMARLAVPVAPSY